LRGGMNSMLPWTVGAISESAFLKKLMTGASFNEDVLFGVPVSTDREISWMTDSVESLKACNDEIANRLKFMNAGVEPNASLAAMADALAQTTTSIRDIWKSTEKKYGLPSKG
jgi:hypothetical protein